MRGHRAAAQREAVRWGWASERASSFPFGEGQQIGALQPLFGGRVPTLRK